MKKMKIEVIVTNRENGQVIAKMETEDFTKSIGLSRNTFAQSAVEEYNKRNLENVARLQVSVMKRNKWIVM